ncbi:MAG: tetratricopeptide repeat protein [Bacillota bacterium]
MNRKRKLHQRIVFGVLAFILSAGLLASSLSFIPGLNGTQAENALPQEQKLPTSEELLEKSNASPNDAGVLKELAQAYTREGQTDKAVETYEKAASLAPDREDIKTALGGSYVSAGKYDQAIGVLDGIISKNPNSKDAYYYYGHALVGKKEYEKAIEKFERFVQLAGEKDPETARVKSIIETLKPLVKK